MLNLFNVEDLPQNYQTFMKMFSTNLFDLIPNFFEIDETPKTTPPQPEQVSPTVQRILSEETLTAVDGKSANKEKRSIYCNLHPKFEEEEQKCLVINMAGKRIILFGFFVLIKLILVTILYLFISKQPEGQTHNAKLDKGRCPVEAPEKLEQVNQTVREKQQNTILVKENKVQESATQAPQNLTLKVNSYFSFGFYVVLFEAMLLDLIIPSFMNIKQMEIESFAQFLNVIISLSLILISVVLLYSILMASISVERLRLNKELSAEQRAAATTKMGLDKWMFIKLDLKEERSFFSGILPELLLIKDFAVAFFIVSFVGQPVIQLSAAVVIFSASAFTLAKFQPFKSKLMSAPKLVNEIIYFLMSITFFIYYGTSKEMSKQKQYNIFGFGIVSIIGVGVVLNIICGFIGLFCLIKAKCEANKTRSKLSPTTLDQSSLLMAVSVLIHFLTFVRIILRANFQKA